MLIKKLKLQSKVRSLTSSGEKAVTRAFLYKEKGKEYICIHYIVLYFGDNDNKGGGERIRSVGNKWLYKREYSMKLSTELESLINLGILNKTKN